MPRENSFSDEDGRSLTPDLEEEREGVAEPISPTYQQSNPFKPPIPSSENAQNLSSPSKRSLHRVAGTAAGSSRPRLPGIPTPKDRFRAVARKVMAMHRSTMVISNRGVGAEPGVDPRRLSADMQYGQIKQDCVIELFDYSAVRASYGRMTNKEFVNLMNDDKASEREPWVKVRWINIGGVSWDVIKAVSIKYGVLSIIFLGEFFFDAFYLLELHPLALEDLFHARKGTRSKADYFSTQLFLRILCHELGDPADIITDAVAGSTLVGVDIPRSSSPLPFTEDDKDAYEMGRNPSGDQDEQTVYGSVRSTTKRRSTRRRPILPTSSSTTPSPPPPYTGRNRHPSYMSKLENQVCSSLPVFCPETDSWSDGRSEGEEKT